MCASRAGFRYPLHVTCAIRTRWVSRASARYPGDSSFEELIEDLKRVSPEFCLWWPHHDALSALDLHKVMEHPTLGLLEFEQINLQVLSTPDIRVVIYSPLAETKVKMEQLILASSARHP